VGRPLAPAAARYCVGDVGGERRDRRRAFAYEVYGVGRRAEAEAIFDPNVVMNPTDEGPSYGLDAMRNDFER
jgi:hypothetical protein